MVYLVSKEKCVVGIFTNRTWMMSAISQRRKRVRKLKRGYEGCKKEMIKTLFLIKL